MGAAGQGGAEEGGGHMAEHMAEGNKGGLNRERGERDSVRE